MAVSSTVPEFAPLLQFLSRRESVSATDNATLHTRFDCVNRRSAWSPRDSTLPSDSVIDSSTGTVSLAPANRVNNPQLLGYNVLSVSSVHCRRRRCIWVEWVEWASLHCADTIYISYISELHCCTASCCNLWIATIWNRLGSDRIRSQYMDGHVSEHTLVRDLVDCTDNVDLCSAGASDWITATVLPHN